MVLIDQIWDDAVAGPPPAVSGLKHLKKLYSNPSSMKDVGAESRSKYGRSLSMPTSPTTPGTPNNLSPTPGQKNNVWRSVFNPGSNQATKNVGADYFDKPQHANAPTVYDWLYSGEARKLKEFDNCWIQLMVVALQILVHVNSFTISSQKIKSVYFMQYRSGVLTCDVCSSLIFYQ